MTIDGFCCECVCALQACNELKMYNNSPNDDFNSLRWRQHKKKRKFSHKVKWKHQNRRNEKPIQYSIERFSSANSIWTNRSVTKPYLSRFHSLFCIVFPFVYALFGCLFFLHLSLSLLCESVFLFCLLWAKLCKQLHCIVLPLLRHVEYILLSLKMKWT